MYDKYQKQGLEIMAFPCNQFGGAWTPSSSRLVPRGGLGVEGIYAATDDVDADDVKNTHARTRARAGQEPGSNADVQAFAKTNGAKYPVFGKVRGPVFHSDYAWQHQLIVVARPNKQIDVNGGNADPLYKFLKDSTPNALGLKIPIPWNFGKFLCVEGVPTKRFEPTTSPLAIEKDIRKGLGLE